ncbi:hypothetical protein BGZ76_005998 [Entomortierella beljakovae]|nr:hypothetical protein BGZ76_005998 [Entomortierella beljakovae]
MTKLQSPGFHQSNNQASNFQYEGDMHDSSNYQHELEPMYQNGGEYDNHMHQMDHHGDMHQDYNQNYDGNYDNDGNFHHDPSSNMQQDHHSHFDQGHNQGFQNDGQGFQGDSQGFQGDSQGFQGDSQGFQGGDNGQGFHGDNGQGIYSDGQGFDGNGQGFDQGGNGQGFGSQGGSGQGFQGGDGSFGHTQPTTTPGNTGIHNIGGAFPLVPPPLLNKPKMRPESSNQYSILTPASPTNTTFSGEGGLVDETAIPAQGSMTISPLPLDYRTSITSSHDSWDDQSQAYGYSPQSKQALLNQTKFYEAATQHNSGRVLPSPSPKVATIALAQPAGVRAPQDAGQADIVGAMVSSGNVSSLNTFDRRHPQLSGGDGRDGVFYVSSESSRNPQDNH